MLVETKVVMMWMAETMAEMKVPKKVGWRVAKRVGSMADWMAQKIHLA